MAPLVTGHWLLLIFATKLHRSYRKRWVSKMNSALGQKYYARASWAGLSIEMTVPSYLPNELRCIEVVRWCKWGNRSIYQCKSLWSTWQWGVNLYFTGFLIRFSEMWMTLPHKVQYKVSWKNLLILLFWPNDSPRWMWTQDSDSILAVTNEEMEISFKGGNSEWKFSFSLLSNSGSTQTCRPALTFCSGRRGFQAENFIFSAKVLLSLG